MSDPRSTETRFRTLVDGSVQGILVHDREFRVLFVNRVMAEFLGFDQPEDAVGSDLLGPLRESYDEQESREQFEGVMAGTADHAPQTFEYRWPAGLPHGD